MYKKVGIMLNDISAQEAKQMNIYGAQKNIPKQNSMMIAVDRVTTKWGTDKLTFAATGIGEDQPWQPKKGKKSACFTTSWHELLTIKTE